MCPFVRRCLESNSQKRAALSIAGVLGGSSIAELREISIQHFNSNLLAAGRVRKLSVVNGTLVRVHVAEPDPESSMLEMSGGAPPKTSLVSRRMQQAIFG